MVRISNYYRSMWRDAADCCTARCPPWSTSGIAAS
ncbi:unnamed protein product [Penicillium camemberti]|uniref:Str. FM013 n=1 Tax=Penicillium camemberti (strain FM 013) TaxID=1429867 RepID=A0A0G4PPU0_PENC3|nr:unnamed protein product [Penicillium camemberti]